MKGNANYVFILLCSFVCNKICAQQSYYKTLVYDKESKGIQLSTLLQDATGYIWLGTNKGVCKYDGIKYNYIKNSAQEVTALAQDKTNCLWIGYSTGKIDLLKNDVIQHFNPEEGLPNIKITDIVFDALGRLWFSTYGEGIYCYDNNILYNINADDSLSDNIVYKLLLMPDNTIWAATDRGISICSFLNKKKQIHIINDQQGLPDNIVRNISIETGTTNVWLCMQDKGLCYIDYKTKKIATPTFATQWPYGQVNDAVINTNQVYIATETNGVIELDKNATTPNRNIINQSNPKQAVLKLLKDNDAYIWLLQHNALSINTANKFYTWPIPKLYNDIVKAMTSDTEGNIWFVNKKGFFTKPYHSTQIQKINISIALETVVSLYADANKNIWIGTYDNGLYGYNAITKKTLHYTSKDGIIDNNIFTIAGNKNDIWLGTFGGATKMNTSNAIPSFENFTKSNGLSNNYIYNINIDKQNHIWFATDGSGLTVRKGNQFLRYNSIVGLENNVVYTSTQDIYGNIWFTGNNSGLFKFDGKQFYRLTETEGLHDNNILNLIADYKGNLIITHPTGIEIFDIKKNVFSFYDKTYGFDSITTQLNAWCKSSLDKNVLLATSNGIVHINGNIDYTIHSKTILEQVNVLLKPIDFNNTNVFKHNENDISFHYIGLSYINPEAVTYAYKLEGFTSDWIETKDNSITFSNLPPGAYVFKVRSSINKNIDSASIVTYAFTIKKAFWQTIWFALLLLLTLGGIIYYFVTLRIRLIKMAQQRKNEKLSAQLEMLKRQLNPHFLFNSFNTLLNIIDTKEKKLAIEYTEKISDFYRSLVLVQDKSMITLHEEIEILKNYMYLQQKRFGDNIKLVLDVNKQQINYGIPPLTLQLLAENAQKHNIVNNENPLVIKISSAQDYVIVSNAIKPQTDSIMSTGTGLTNIKQRVKMLTGKEVNVVQHEKEFNVIVPLKIAP